MSSATGATASDGRPPLAGEGLTAKGPTSTITAATIRNKLLTLVGHGLAATPAEVRRSAYAQLMRHATDGKLTLDLEQTRLDDISQAWEHLKAGAARKLVVTP